MEPGAVTGLVVERGAKGKIGAQQLMDSGHAHAGECVRREGNGRGGMSKRILLLLCLPLALAGGDDYFPPPDSAGGWRTLTGAAKIRKLAGMDLARLDQAYEFEKETSQHGGLILRQG
jgi:hypothetical protein